VAPDPLVVAAATSYAANCALGQSVACGIVDTHRIRWVHHAVYICTSALTVAAAARALMTDRRTASALAPVFVPLALIPYVSAKTLRHPRLALTAAPFYAAALIVSTRKR
jgi:hypothetical protein